MLPKFLIGSVVRAGKSRSSGKKLNFDEKPQNSRNDSSYQSFQCAVSDSVKSACEQGLFGWEVTDLKVCFTYGLYYSPVSTPSDFRHLTPLVFEQALIKAETELLEPFMDFELHIPKEYSSKVMYDLQQMRARIERFNAEKDETIMYGRIPTETSKTYQVQLTSYTNGKGVFLTNPCGYDIYVGMPLYKARKESASIDKTRHLFLKENV